MTKQMISIFQDHVNGFKNLKLTKEQSICNWTMGLAGETGEVLECIRDYVDSELEDESYDLRLLRKELGDLFWYTFALTDELGIPFTDIVDMTVEMDVNTFYVPNRYDLNYLQEIEGYSVAIAIESLKVVDVVKKCAFHSKGFEDLTKVKTTLANFLWFVCLLMDEMGISFDGVLQMNIDKLTKRHEGTAFNVEAADKNKALGG